MPKVIIIFISVFISCLYFTFASAGEELPLPDLRPDIEYKAEDLRDPFEEYVVKEATPETGLGGYGFQRERPLPKLEVQGLIWGGYLPQAIINNQVVKVGDVIEGAKVISIDKTGVTVFFEYRNYLLSPAGRVSAPVEDKTHSELRR